MSGAAFSQTSRDERGRVAPPTPRRPLPRPPPPRRPRRRPMRRPARAPVRQGVGGLRTTPLRAPRPLDTRADDPYARGTDAPHPAPAPASAPPPGRRVGRSWRVAHERSRGSMTDRPDSVASTFATFAPVAPVRLRAAPPRRPPPRRPPPRRPPPRVARPPRRPPPSRPPPRRSRSWPSVPQPCWSRLRQGRRRRCAPHPPTPPATPAARPSISRSSPRSTRRPVACA